MTDVHLWRYFSNFGLVVDCVVIHDKISRRPRGFGFVTFAEREAFDTCLKDQRDATKMVVRASESR